MFGDLLEIYLKKQGMSLTELGRQTNKSYQYIQMIIANKRAPSFEHLTLISKALDLSSEEKLLFLRTCLEDKLNFDTKMFLQEINVLSNNLNKDNKFKHILQSLHKEEWNNILNLSLRLASLDKETFNKIIDIVENKESENV